MPSLFDPVTFGPLALPNRIVMAPLTRGRATRDGVPTPIMAQYYAQRASAGLIVSEATGISREGLGWPFAPGLWSEAQVAGWRPVTAAVHAAGGRIVAQLWHMGRLVHPDLGGGVPLSASATRADGLGHTFDGKKPYAEARAATAQDIARIVGDYATAARNAVAAGFDGVQIHGANGYLIDQFMRASVNHRCDGYGGAIDHRLRLVTEVVAAVGGEIGIGRVGIRFSPNSVSHGVVDPDPEALFVALARRVEDMRVPWVELREPRPGTSFGLAPTAPVSHAMRSIYSGKIVLNSDYDGATAQTRLDEGVSDAISFGRTFLANPDLPERIAQGAPLSAGDPVTFYSAGAAGYTDYPAFGEQVAG